MKQNIKKAATISMITLLSTSVLSPLTTVTAAELEKVSLATVDNTETLQVPEVLNSKPETVESSKVTEVQPEVTGSEVEVAESRTETEIVETVNPEVSNQPIEETEEVFSNVSLGSRTGSLLGNPNLITLTESSTDTPPEDEEDPDVLELKLLADMKSIMDDLEAVRAEGEANPDDLEFAKEIVRDAIMTADKVPGGADVNQKYADNLEKITQVKPASERTTLINRYNQLRAWAGLDSISGGTDTPIPPTPPGPKKEVKTEKIPITTTYKEDKNLAYGQRITVAGTEGEKTWTETDGVKDVDSENITKKMIPMVVTVGTKPTVVTEVVPAPTDVEETDDTLYEDERVLKTPAKDGSKTITTTYTLNTKTGEVVANTPTEETVMGTAAVYRVGTKKRTVTPVVTTRTEPIAIETEYIADPTAEANVQTIVREGSAGEKTFTTTDGVEGAGQVTKEMVTKRVKVGTKPTVVTEVVPAPADVEETDDTLYEDERVLKTPAKDGSKTTTTTYTLNTKTGEVVANTPTEETVAGTAAVYRVGTKKREVPVPPIAQKDETVTEIITFEKVIRENPELPKGTTRVIQAGKNGKRVVIYTITYDENGTEINREVKSDVTTPAVAEITEVGTKEEVKPTDKDQDKPFDKASAPKVDDKLDTEPKQEVSTTQTKAILPQTGELSSPLAVFGLAIVSIVGLLVKIGRREKE